MKRLLLAALPAFALSCSSEGATEASPLETVAADASNLDSGSLPDVRLETATQGDVSSSDSGDTGTRPDGAPDTSSGTDANPEADTASDSAPDEAAPDAGSAGALTVTLGTSSVPVEGSLSFTVSGGVRPYHFATNMCGAVRGSVAYKPTSFTYFAPSLAATCNIVVMDSSAPANTTTIPVQVTGAVAGNVRFVSPSGDDSGSGTLDSPWATVSHALSQSIARPYYIFVRGAANDCPAAVAEGGAAASCGSVRDEVLDFSDSASGTGEDARVIVSGYPNEWVRFQSSTGSFQAWFHGNYPALARYITLQDLVVDCRNNTSMACVKLEYDGTGPGAHHNVFQRLIVRNMGMVGAEECLSNPSGDDDVLGSCVQSHEDSDNSILDTEVYNCGRSQRHGGQALYLGGKRWRVEGGSVHDSMHAMQFWQQGSNTFFLPPPFGQNTVNAVEVYNIGCNTGAGRCWWHSEGAVTLGATLRDGDSFTGNYFHDSFPGGIYWRYGNGETFTSPRVTGNWFQGIGFGGNLPYCDGAMNSGPVIDLGIAISGGDFSGNWIWSSSAPEVGNADNCVSCTIDNQGDPGY
jgi:hypothetical protein